MHGQVLLSTLTHICSAQKMRTLPSWLTICCDVYWDSWHRNWHRTAGDEWILGNMFVPATALVLAEFNTYGDRTGPLKTSLRHFTVSLPAPVFRHFSLHPEGLARLAAIAYGRAASRL